MRRIRAERGPGDREGALTIYLDQLKRTPMLDLAARAGDLHAQAHRLVEADRYYQLAEDLAGPSILWHASQIEPATTALLVPTIRRDSSF